jgi:hypothetical protein
MKVRCISNKFQLVEDETGHVTPTTSQNTTVWLDIGKAYEIISIERGWYRIIDESGEDYLYPPELFEVFSV